MNGSVKKFSKAEVVAMMSKLSRNFSFRRMLDTCDAGVVGVAEGGVTFAKFLADKYNLPLYTVETHTYDNEKGVMLETMTLKIPIALLDRRKEKFMFVDDVYETGKTWDALHALFPNSKLVVLIDKSGTKKDDVFSGEFLPREQWVEFEW